MKKCRRCQGELDPRRTFCPGCGLLREPGLLRIHASTDETRGRALEEMYRGVKSGQAEFHRDIEQRFEREVYEHYKGNV